MSSNIFTPTEAQRRDLDRLWRTYDRTVRRPTSDLTTAHANDFRKRIEETIAANIAGYSTPEEFHDA